MWEGIKYTRQSGGDTISPEAGGEVRFIDLAPYDFTDSNAVTSRFHHNNEHYNQHGQNGGPFKPWEAKIQWWHDADPVSVTNGTKIGIAHKVRHHSAAHETD